MDESKPERTHDTTSVPQEVPMSTRHENQPTEQKTSKQAEEEAEEMDESESKRIRDSNSFTEELLTCKKHKNEVESKEQTSTEENVDSSASKSEYGDIPKALPNEGCLPGFRTSLDDLKNTLTRDTFRMLASALDFKPEEREKVETSGDPGHVFVHSLKEKGIIRETDISVLTEKLNSCGLHGVADDVNESFHRYQSQAKPQLNQSLEYKEKKTQFVKEVKSAYEKQCGGIQPVSFLRYKDKISKLFVDGGIKLIEKTQGKGTEKEKLVQLGKYNTMFIDPKAKSKRRIIDGGPGYGKSTLALQITHDWCQEKTWMNKFEILILLRLKQLKNVPSIYSAIKKFLLPKDSKLTEDDIKSILDSSSTVILLDGYDEYPDRQNEDTDINHIIRGDMFHEHEVILTTRTSCLPPNHGNASIKYFRLTGFDETSRQTYFQNVVAPGCSDDVTEIREFLHTKIVPDDVLKIPLVFSMVCYMVKINERFRKFSTVTEAFHAITRCFHCHSETKGNRAEELDHSKLDEIAFAGLVCDTQDISWDTNNLRDKIGKDLYEEYVRIGILIEVDFDTLNHSKRTRFFHKLFAQWYAAHYLAKAAAQPKAEFEKWPAEYMFPPLKRPSSQQAGTFWPSPKAAKKRKVHFLKSQNPHYVHYMYQFACGLNHNAALKIMKHLGTNELYDRYTMLCMAEWGGELKTIKDKFFLSQLYSHGISICCLDNYPLQATIMKLFKFAVAHKIDIPVVFLRGCILKELYKGYARLFLISPTRIYMPVIDTLGKMVIDLGYECTYERTADVLYYAGKCKLLTEVLFCDCMLPRSIKGNDIPSGFRVEWKAGFRHYILDDRTGNWQDIDRDTAMTDEEYEEEKESFLQIQKIQCGQELEDSEESDA